MDLALNIKGDGSGADAAFRDVASEAQDAAATIEQAFAGMAKKTDAAFKQMEGETAASMKKMGDEGEAAWKRAEAAEKSSAAQLAKVQAGLLAAGAAAVAFGVDSVHAFAEAQKVQMQLERAAGGLTEAFSQQADALEAQLHIDGELIKQQQTLLLQWGAAPSEIEPAIRAIQDYAAASGKDGVQATKDFLQAVENGDGKLAKYGISFEQTGDKAKDFTTLTNKLRDALGGAAEANANSLQGSLDAVTIAFGNVKESFGGVIGAMEQKTGVLQRTAGFFSRWAAQISSAEGIMETLGAMSNTGQVTALLGGFMSGPQMPDITGGAVSKPAPVFLTGPDGKRATGKDADSLKERAQAAKEAAEYEDKLDAEATQLIETIARQTAEWEKNNAAMVGSTDGFKNYVENTKLVADSIKNSLPLYDKLYAAQQEANKKAMKKRDEDAAKFTAASAKANAEALQAQEAQWASAGAQIGGAFVGALSSELEKMSAGGEFDVAIFVGEIIASAVAIAGTVIGSAYGQPALGAALGNLAAMGVRAGAGAISANNHKKPKTMHSGGWVGEDIDIPRYHSGAWIGSDERAAILQTGERVLARNEVHHMGGPGAVDNLAKGRGGPAITNYIQAIDSKNAAESFMADLGQGMKRALRTGHGDVPRLLGSPR
ncbi:MAG: hypothetical protein WC700_18690 [Gemmatimonadaceae bacterium]